jgi:hypothetical protein
MNLHFFLQATFSLLYNLTFNFNEYARAAMMQSLETIN